MNCLDTQLSISKDLNASLMQINYLALYDKNKARLYDNNGQPLYVKVSGIVLNASLKTNGELSCLLQY